MILEIYIYVKKLALAALLAAGSSVAMADNDVGCGVGTQVWAGQKGVVPKILAATTNGIFTNQLLGITFGTLGCRQGGTVTAQVVTFTNENAEALARDMAVGQGESLNVLAELMQIKPQDKDVSSKFQKQTLVKSIQQTTKHTSSISIITKRNG
jgi:hypothetical protein